MRLIIVCSIVLLIFSCKKSDNGSDVQPPPPVTLKSSASNIVLQCLSGSEDSFNITPGTGWTMALNPSTTPWAHLTSAKDGKVYVTAMQDNTTGSQRSATIVISPVNNASTQPVTISLTQNPQVLTDSFLLWKRALGGSSTDLANHVAATPDGGCIIAARTSSKDGDPAGISGNGFTWLVKLDASGNTQWQKLIGNTQTVDAYPDDIILTQDGGYALTGWVGNTQSNDMWIVKLNSSGDVTWQKTLGGNVDDYGKSIIQTSDGGFAVAGYSSSNNGDFSGNHGGLDVWIIKLTNSGDVAWQKLIGGSYSDWAYDILPTPDDGFIVVGASRSNDGDIPGNHGDSDAWVARLDKTGNLVWQKSFGGSGLDYFNSIIATPDGGFVAAGSTSSNDGDVSGNHGGADGWLVKLTGDGNVTWQKTLGGPLDEGATSLTLDAAGDLIMAGSRGSDCWLAKVKNDGTVVNETFLGGSEADLFNSITTTQDGRFIAVGNTSSSDGFVSGYHGGTYDVWAVKFQF